MNANDLLTSAFQAIMELNLEPIKVKLMHVESGEGWSLDKANAVEREYRRFLCLMKMYPEEDTAPMVDVDTFWHYHILDTMKYAADCQQAFGYFLHHYPYVGLRGEDDEQFRLDSGERMRTLYEATFGDTYPGAQAAGAGDAAFCAGPGAKAAFCAGPGAEAAFCAGPGAEAAFCAGPGAKAAFCAGPGAKAAFCAGPGVTTAFCAGPGAKIAYRGGADQKRGVLAAQPAATATAFCAGPGIQAACYPGAWRHASTNAVPAA